MAHVLTIEAKQPTLDYHEAGRLASELRTYPSSGFVVVDLSAVDEATTAAWARLVLLRRSLLKRGADLGIRGLHGRARNLYEICRLEKVLPTEPEGDQAPPPDSTHGPSGPPDSSLREYPG